MKKETLEEAAKNNYPDGDVWTVEQAVIRRLAFMNGANYQAERMYSEEDMKQFAFECVTNFLSNNDNKVEIKLVDVIIDRLNSQFEQFKKK
jgi:hypothetical protein